jgi:two-component system, response regulator PdtaR
MKRAEFAAYSHIEIEMQFATSCSLRQMRSMGKRVLVCEDNHTIAMGWAMMLSTAGYEVIGPVHDAEKALEEAYKQMPDLALIDIALNGIIDGISVAAELAPLGVPVIFVTADYQRATSEGREFASDILIKPIRQSTLLTTVATVLDQKRK